MGATTFDAILREYAFSFGIENEVLESISGQSIVTVERYAKQASMVAFNGE